MLGGSAKAAALLAAGGLALYPTETLWALGCSVYEETAVMACFSAKRRPLGKPLPVLGASLGQLGDIVDLEAAPPGLLPRFWPGPLTVVLPGAEILPSGLRNAQGKTAVRIAGAGWASSLAAAVGAPLVATSANLSGSRAAATLAELDKSLFAALDATGVPWGIFNPGPAAGQGVPSTVVEPRRHRLGWRLKLLRCGAITRAQLRDGEWELI